MARNKLPPSKKHRIYVRDGGVCHYCGIECRPFGTNQSHERHDDAATLDHVQTRAEGGGNHDQNLVLSCHKCNNMRSCIPYHIFLNRQLWMHPKMCATYHRLFAIGVQTVKDETKNVWLLELYTECPHMPTTVQNWGVFASAQGVHRYMAEKFPDAVLAQDEELGYIGYHFPADHPLTDTSFVANAWDLQ